MSEGKRRWHASIEKNVLHTVTQWGFGLTALVAFVMGGFFFLSAGEIVPHQRYTGTVGLALMFIAVLFVAIVVAASVVRRAVELSEERQRRCRELEEENAGLKLQLTEFYADEHRTDEYAPPVGPLPTHAASGEPIRYQQPSPYSGDEKRRGE